MANVLLGGYARHLKHKSKVNPVGQKISLQGLGFGGVILTRK
jgi:hypothetical protein